MSDALAPRRPVVLGIWLIIAGAVGWFAAFELIVDKINSLANTDFVPSCDISILVQCTKNLNSWQGSLLGFPNPIIGLTAWPIVIVMGVALLAGIRFPGWFWRLFNLGVVLALALVVFLIISSIYFLGTLCPWCMVTWLVTIPTFWIVTLRSMRDYGSGGVQRVGRALYGWVPILSLVCYVIVAGIAQVQLDVIAYL